MIGAVCADPSARGILTCTSCRVLGADTAAGVPAVLLIERITAVQAGPTRRAPVATATA